MQTTKKKPSLIFILVGAVLAGYGEDGEWVFDMITLCSEMKKGTLDWDNAAEIYEAYNTACVRENQEWLREQNGVEY